MTSPIAGRAFIMSHSSRTVLPAPNLPHFLDGVSDRGDSVGCGRVLQNREKSGDEDHSGSQGRRNHHQGYLGREKH